MISPEDRGKERRLGAPLSRVPALDETFFPKYKFGNVEKFKKNVSTFAAGTAYPLLPYFGKM